MKDELSKITNKHLSISWAPFAKGQGFEPGIEPSPGLTTTRGFNERIYLFR